MKISSKNNNKVNNNSHMAKLNNKISIIMDIKMIQNNLYFI